MQKYQDGQLSWGQMGSSTRKTTLFPTPGVPGSHLCSEVEELGTELALVEEPLCALH